MGIDAAGDFIAPIGINTGGFGSRFDEDRDASAGDLFAGGR